MKKIIALTILTLALFAGTTAAQAAMDACRDGETARESEVYGSVLDGLYRPMTTAVIEIEHYTDTGVTTHTMRVNPVTATYRWKLPSCGYVIVKVRPGKKKLPAGYWDTTTRENDFYSFEVRHFRFVYVFTAEKTETAETVPDSQP